LHLVKLLLQKVTAKDKVINVIGFIEKLVVGVVAVAQTEGIVV